ncbi:hypothetical protein FNU76_02995 [Chitinimonas arctica]|uniref:Uncharacterized protein n=1 Tax=Chitinimonas arctica TaxID=2594795 RepID=A0A516SB81_9NEIS|nr:hypothetical protein [Chitinimonas arctica]QDQ25404.1 hypothetical protein FNU76_02995 [Chitinimonas arctica]
MQVKPVFPIPYEPGNIVGCLNNDAVQLLSILPIVLYNDEPRQNAPLGLNELIKPIPAACRISGSNPGGHICAIWYWTDNRLCDAKRPLAYLSMSTYSILGMRSTI